MYSGTGYWYCNNDEKLTFRQSQSGSLLLIGRDIDKEKIINRSNYYIVYQIKHLLVKVAFIDFDCVFEQEAIQVYPFIKAPNKFKTFANIDEFMIDGVIHIL